MFLLRNRANSNSTLATVGIEDSTSVDISGGSSDTNVNCSTPGPRRRTDQVVSDKRPIPQPTRSASGRWLSENEKARISIYLQIMNVMVAALVATKNYSVFLFEFIRAQGLTDMLYLPASLTITGIMVSTSLALYAAVLLHQSLVSIFSSFLLVNATFFTIQPYPPRSPASHTLKGRPSKIALASASDGTNATQAVQNTQSGTESRPLIDLSGRSSEAGDTPPVQTVLLPEVLSPTQLQLRSLSPAFNASMQQVKEREIEEIMQPSGRPETSMALAAILSRRSDFGPLMYGRNPVERSMSTVSYPDIYGGGSSADSEEETNGQYKLMQDTIYESEQELEEQESPVNPPNFDTDPDFDDEEEGEDMQFPLPSVQEEEIAFTSSPTHLAPAAEPEVIDVLDAESRQATIDAAVPAVMTMPVPHTDAHSSEHVTLSLTPPSSRVATMIQTTTESVQSPRDIFSPTPRSFPQPGSGLPFAFPFLREQLQQHLESPPATSISQWNQTVVESNKKKDEADERIGEPTPYPSPPFTPPSSRPPTIYSSMALQIPPRNPVPETLTTPDPFVVDRSPLSALEEAKAEAETEPVETVTQAAVEPDVQEPDVAPTEAPTETLYEPSSPIVEQEETPVSPSYLDIANEIVMPTARQGILRNPLSYVQQVQQAPPRTVSPLKSIGRGGLLDGSRIPVDEYSAESSVVPTAEPEPTLVASAAEESFKEADSLVDQEPEYNVASELHHLRSGATSGADDESTAPKPKADKKKKKKTKKTKKGVSFDEVPFVIGSDAEREDNASETNGSEAVFSDVASPSYVSSPLAAAPIPIPRTFEIEEEEEVVPEPVSQNFSTEAFQGSPTPSRPLSLMSELMSPRSTADELSDSSMMLPPGQYSDKQVDHYGRWFARAHRDKALPTIQALRDQMQGCSDTELAGRLRLGSRSDPTKLSKSLVGEDNMKGVGAQGSLPPPPIRKGSSYRRRR